MKNSLFLKGGRVVDPSQNLDQESDILLLDGRVEAIEPNMSMTDENIRVVDVSGKVVSPGWVDIHTHLREPGFTHKETIKTGSESAAAGGFTSIACMANTNPVNDNPFITSYIYQKAAAESRINVYVIGAISKGLEGKQIAEIGSMWEAGIVAISDDGMTVMDAYIMRKAMDYSTRFKLPVIIHGEDCNLKGKGVMNEGYCSAQLGLRGIPKTSEDLIVARDIMLAEHTGAQLHIAHVSTATSVNLVREAKRRGLNVTAEVTPHHLTLTDEAVANYDTNTKVAPPLREQVDIEALCEGVRDGTIDALATDHAPHSVIEKEVEYDLAAFGMIGFETAFPLYLRLHTERDIPLSTVIAAMTYKPANILNLPKGTLKVGEDADVTVFDLTTRYQIRKESFHSKSQNSPFHGWNVQGKVHHTIVGGNIIFSSSQERGAEHEPTAL